MTWMLAIWGVQTVLTWLIRKIVDIDKAKLQKAVDAVAQAANENIDGLAKKNMVVDKLGDIAQNIIDNQGMWALNFLIEALVALLKAQQSKLK